jgi:ribose-phosphate pyrophosphokinase
MVDTAGTMVKAASALKKLGATSVMACCTHPVLSGPAYDRIENGELDELVITNTLPIKQSSNKIKVLSTAKMLGEVIRRVYNNESVNSLFETN